MDINETRFHLVMNRKEWLGNLESPPQVDLSWDSSCNAVRLTPRLFRFPTPADTPQLTPSNRRGAARDRYGNWYWIAENKTEIQTISLNQRKAARFWHSRDLVQTCKSKKEHKTGAFQPAPPAPLLTPLSLSGLAVTTHHYLVVGVLDPAGLLIFDLHAGGAPLQLLWPKDTPFVPFDMAASADGGLWILDAENSTCWKMDRHFQLAPSHPIELEAKHAVAVETASDGSILILDTNPERSFSTVYHCIFNKEEESFNCQGVSLWPLLRQKKKSEPVEQSHLRGHDLAFVPAEPANNSNLGDNNRKRSLHGTIYIADSIGNQVFAFLALGNENVFSLELLPTYLPMRFYTGKALVADGQTVYYDMQELWLPLTAMPRPRFREKGQLTLPVFDGKEPWCTWHRLFLDAYIPPGTRVIVESYATNKEDDIPEEDKWKPEPPLYCRGNGSELPYYNFFSSENELPEGKGTWELLFQEARGRYLHLRLTITGPGNMTPYLYALRVYYPRFSYLKEYLPTVYRDINQYPQEYQEEIEEGREFVPFLERFLANIEGFYTVLEGRIAQAQALFDIDITAKEYLDWLASWFGVILDPAWDEARRRLFLRHAIELFNQRGTPSGLIRAIRLAIDPCPDDTLFEEDVLDSSYQKAVGFSVRIVEEFLTRTHPGVTYGDPTDIIGPGLSLEDEPWTTKMGAESLHQRYRAYLQQKYKNIQALNQAWLRENSNQYNHFNEIFLPPTKPVDKSETVVNDWLGFLETSIGFTYMPVDADDYSHRWAYQKFLARRYQQVGTLNKAYQWTTSANKLDSLAKIELPKEMPSGGQQLEDWIKFVSQVLAIKETAHRFIVLVPMEPDMDMETRQQRLEQVKRIVEIEKPAHTYFRVKPYWALLRVGSARLGLDTLPGIGSRYTALLLGKNALAQSYLAASHPWDVKDRRVLGRDEVGK
jgi:phage tail-like protein